MMKFTKIGNKLLPVFVLVAVLILAAGDAEAASGIFEQVRSKVAKTLHDVRNIVYVVGAIGLISFTFAAIFGRISFKHLATLCFSLFLLSVMQPFVTFFSGSTTALSELGYGDYTSGSGGAADDATTSGKCSAGTCPTSTGSGSGARKSATAGGGYTPPQFIGDTEIDGGTLDEVTVTAQRKSPTNSLGSLTAGLTIPEPTLNIDLSTITQQTPTVDTRTGWQKFKDTIKTVASEGKKAYSTASSVYSAAKNVRTAYDNTKNAVGNINGITDIGNILNAGTTIANSVQNIAGNVQNAASDIGTNYTDREGKTKAGDKVGAALDGVVTVAKEGRDVAETGTDIKNTVDAGVRMGDDIIHGRGIIK